MPGFYTIDPEQKLDIELGIRLRDVAEKTMERQNLINRPGHLNYCITKLLIQVFSPLGNLSDLEHEDIVGIIEGAIEHIYEKGVAPYEDLKIEENGDVEKPKRTNKKLLKKNRSIIDSLGCSYKQQSEDEFESMFTEELTPVKWKNGKWQDLSKKKTKLSFSAAKKLLLSGLKKAETGRQELREEDELYSDHYKNQKKRNFSLLLTYLIDPTLYPAIYTRLLPLLLSLQKRF